MKNWAGNLKYRASAIHYPRSVEEVCDLVRHNTNVKVLGTRHSFNRIADCPDVSVQIETFESFQYVTNIVVINRV